MNLLSRFTKPDYLSGEDFLKNYSYTVPKGFNFVRDVMARICLSGARAVGHDLDQRAWGREEIYFSGYEPAFQEGGERASRHGNRAGRSRASDAQEAV